MLRQTSRPRICRILWGIVTGALLLVTLFTVGSLLQEYLRHESFDKTSTSWKDNLTLPALTICSSNFINYTRLREVMTEEGDSDALEALRRVLSLLERYDGAGDFFELYEANKATFKQLVSYENRRGSIQLRFSLNLDAVIFGTPHYFFDGRGKNITDPRKHMQTTKSGMCLEFNNDETFQQSNGGPKGGFSIDLNTNVRDYLPTTSSHGFTVFIRDPDENVMLNVGGFVISPGTETFVRLTSKSAKRLGPPHGTCKNVPNIYSKRNVKFESIRECWQRQVIQAMIGKCGCIPIYFAAQMFFWNKTHILDEFGEEIKQYRAQKEYEKRYEWANAEVNYTSLKKAQGTQSEKGLGDSIQSISNQIADRFMRAPFYKYVCGLVQETACAVLVDTMIKKRQLQFERCPEPCQYNEWDTAITSIPFPPTETYFKKFLKNEDLKTYEHAKNNVVRLHVYYDDIRVQQTTQIPAYQPHNFIAEFGGTVDLFIGFSFFTVLQLIEIGIAACVFRCRENKNVKV